MSTTFQQFINDMLADAGVINPGQTAGTVNFGNGVRAFNRVVSNWSSKRERLFYVPESPYTLSNGVYSYQVGPGASHFPTSGGFTRPVFVQSGVIIVGNARRWPMNILTAPQWNACQNRGLSDADGPTDFYYGGASPIGIFNVAPAPTGSKSMLLDQWNPLKTFAVTDTVLLMEDYYPAEYIRGLQAAGALEISPGYRLQPNVAAAFQEALTIIETKNLELLAGSFGPTRTLDVPSNGERSPQNGAR